MATIAERFRGISGDQHQRTISYVVEGALSDQDALNLAELAAPVTYDLMPRQNIQITEVDKKSHADRQWGNPGEDIEEQDPTVPDGTYYIDAIYSRQRGTQPVEFTSEKPTPAQGTTDGNHNTFSFEQTLSSIRIRESGNVPDRYTAGGAGVPNQDDMIRLNGINVQGDGSVEGVDIRAPMGAFSYDYFPATGAVTQTYQDLVTGMVGKVNSAVFFGKAAGEVLFVSAQGRKRNQSDWEFNFRFEHNPNAVGLTVGEGSNQITYSKLGWQYAWVYYDEVDDTNEDGEKRSILVPRQVTVETIYATADLNTLFP